MPTSSDKDTKNALKAVTDSLDNASDKKLRQLYDKFQDTPYDSVPVLLKQVHQAATLLPIEHGPKSVSIWATVVRQSLPSSPKTLDFMQALLTERSAPTIMFRVSLKDAKVIWLVHHLQSDIWFEPTGYDEEENFQALSPLCSIYSMDKSDDGILMTPDQFRRFKMAGKRTGSDKMMGDEELEYFQLDRSRPTVNARINGKAQHTSSLKHPFTPQFGDVDTYSTLKLYRTAQKPEWKTHITALKTTDPAEYERQLLAFNTDLEMDHVPQNAILLYAPHLVAQYGGVTKPVFEWLRELDRLAPLVEHLQSIHKLINTLQDPKSCTLNTAKHPAWVQFNKVRGSWDDWAKSLALPNLHCGTPLGKEKPPLTLAQHLSPLFENTSYIFKAAIGQEFLSSASELFKHKAQILELLAADIQALTQKQKGLKALIANIKTTQEKEGLCIAVPKHIHALTRTYGKDPSKKLKKQLESATTRAQLETIFANELYEDYLQYFEVLKEKKETQLSPRKSKPTPQKEPHLDALYIVGAIRTHYKKSIKRWNIKNTQHLDTLLEEMTRWALKFG